MSITLYTEVSFLVFSIFASRKGVISGICMAHCCGIKWKLDEFELGAKLAKTMAAPLARRVLEGASLVEKMPKVFNNILGLEANTHANKSYFNAHGQ